MTRVDRGALFATVYALLDEPPHRFDCGRLCGRRCCDSGCAGESVEGMRLLPGEKQFLQSVAPFAFIYKQSEDGDVLVCNGRCDRAVRPIACRIFPYYAKIAEKAGRVDILLRRDPRSLAVCPLVSESPYRPTPAFCGNFKRAMRLLIKDEEIADDVRKTSSFNESLLAFYRKFDNL